MSATPPAAPHSIRLYNTLSRRVEELRPITPGKVTIYTCGSTVYRYAHIGNLRTYLFGDLLRRTLDYLGYATLYVKNITDVGHTRETGEDPILTQAQFEGKSAWEIAAFYTDAWLEDERLLNIEPPDVMPKATGHIPEMIELITALLAKGLAYEANGNVYFDVSAYPGYGALSGTQAWAAKPGTRVELEPDKRAPVDFALWKHAEPDRSMQWPSPWGAGFPGWHIECSAMSMKYLGDRFDVHTGGIDLKFPHHEDEIAQSEGVTGHPVVSVWLHGEFLTLGDEKMAKSAGNIIRVSELPSKGFAPLDFRYLALTAHYRSKLDFTHDAMVAAASGLRRLRRAVAGASEADAPVDLSTEPMPTYRTRFTDAIGDDLGLPAALAVAHAVASADDLAPHMKRTLLLDFDRVLGLSLNAPAEAEAVELPPGAAELLERRATTRAAKDWAASDRLREELAGLGVEVRDTPEGQVATPRP